MKIEELKLSALKYFIDAVETESISKSALINHVSRPAVSQAILRLGDWYGKALLKHEKRSFVLTPSGQEFYQRAKLSLQSLSLHFLDENKTSLKIGVSASLAHLILPRIKKYLKKSRELELSFGTSDQLIEKLRAGVIRLAFVVDNRSELGLHRQALHAGQFKVLSKTGHFGGALITTEKRREVESFEIYLRQKKILFDSVIKVESWTFAIELAEMGLGTCLVPDFMPTENLKRVKTEDWNEQYLASLYLRKAQGLTALEHELVENLSSENYF